MSKKYQFLAANNKEQLSDLKKQWLRILTSPQDGMWDAFRNYASPIAILDADNWMGYACIRDNHELIQFYILPEYMSEGLDIFKQLLAIKNIKTGIVGTNNPVFLSMAMHYTEELDVHTYLFRDSFDTLIEGKEGCLQVGKQEDIDTIVNFCHYSIGAPKDWLKGYIGGLAEKGEIYYFENEETIIGTCEVRSSETAPQYMDIGMIVSPDFRKQGFGTFLLHQAKSIAIEKGKVPICSCEKDNVGSLKSIQNCGFFSNFQLLSVDFKV
ncbi:MAG: GNAT family N-acetyltransferase [Bacteroidota bacterium]